jgi:hypothetical protein
MPPNRLLRLWPLRLRVGRVTMFEPTAHAATSGGLQRGRHVRVWKVERWWSGGASGSCEASSLIKAWRMRPKLQRTGPPWRGAQVISTLAIVFFAVHVLAAVEDAAHGLRVAVTVDIYLGALALATRVAIRRSAA